MRKFWKFTVRILAGAMIVNLIWWIASVLLDMPVLVNPVRVYSALPHMEGMWGHLSASLVRILAGIAVSSAISVPVGILMGLSGKINRILGPVVYFSYPVPKLALLPVVMLLAGIGEVTKVTMIVLITVFQMTVAVRDSVKGIDTDSRNMLVSLGAGRTGLLRYLVIPSILPDFFTALRVAAGTAVSVLFVTETYGTDKGMGYYIVDAWMRIDYVDMYGGIVVLSIAGFAIFMLVDMLGSLLCRWRNV